MNADMVKGRCFENCARLVLFNESERQLRLVHAIGDGRGFIKGQRVEHAFVIEEFDDKPAVAIDVTVGIDRPRVFPLDKYRQLGNVRTELHYTQRDVSDKVMEFEHWGPWDDKVFPVTETVA